jgi:hypothetical protein
MLRTVATAIAVVALAGCAPALHGQAGPPPRATCTPPAGGRCAADVAWPGHILAGSRGRLLHGVINCGGTLAVVQQSASRVTVRLHVGAMGPGTMSCARVDVGARLSAPLGNRPVYDAVSGRRLQVDGSRS